jgi:hypothetical protein
MAKIMPTARPTGMKKPATIATMSTPNATAMTKKICSPLVSDEWVAWG